MALAASFVNANAISIQPINQLVPFQEWEVHGTNYLVSGGPPGNGIILTFPSEQGINYRVEGKMLGLDEPKGSKETGWKGCNWHIRSLPFVGTGDLISITNGTIETEFFRVRKLDP